MRSLVRGIVRKAANRVTDPGDQKQEDEREAERMLIDAQNPASPPDRPRRIGIVGEIARVAVDEFLDAPTPRFGDPF